MGEVDVPRAKEVETPPRLRMLALMIAPPSFSSTKRMTTLLPLFPQSASIMRERVSFTMRDSASVSSGVSTIFNSAFTEWLPQFPNQQLVTLTTKPSATVPGHLFFVDLKTKSVTKILGGRNGLTTLTSRNGKLTLFAEIKNGVPELSFYDVTKKVSHPLYLQTLPEKCVWGVKNTTLAYCAVPQTIPSATYPDQWYQGLVTFSDSMWEIDTTTFNTRKILVPSNLGAPALDIINLALSSNDAYLLFMNKVTGTPWVYTIAEPLLPKAEVSPSAITPDMQKLR